MCHRLLARPGAVPGRRAAAMVSEMEMTETRRRRLFVASCMALIATAVSFAIRVDVLGMKRIVALAFLMHALGVALTIFASGFWMLFAGTLCVGLGNGLVEAFINPLTATLYPDRKTEKLNLLHVW